MTLRRSSAGFALLIVLSIAILSIASHAETVVLRETSGSAVGLTPQPQTSLNSAFSLFDPSRLHMHHSYSIGFFSGGGESRTIAMYLNQIEYQFAKPLRLSVELAYLHQPQTLFGANGSSAVGNRLLPSFHLLWEPSRNFQMLVSYQSLAPHLLYDRSPYWR